MGAPPEVGMSYARNDGGGPTETEVRAHEGAHRGRSPQGVGRLSGRRQRLRRAPRARRLPAEPSRPEVLLGRWARRFPERRPKRWRTPEALRSPPGGEVGGLRRVGGGRAAQALCAGAGAF